MIPLGWAEFSTRIKLGQFASKLVKHARSEVPVCEWWGEMCDARESEVD